MEPLYSLTGSSRVEALCKPRPGCGRRRGRGGTRASTSAPSAERHRRPASRPCADGAIEDALGAGTGCVAFGCSFGNLATTTLGIATQNVVEKQLVPEGLIRHDLGRRRSSRARGNGSSRPGARSWVSTRRLGASLDYSRELFDARRGRLAGGDGVLRAALEPGRDPSGQPDRDPVPVPPDADLRTSRSSTRRWTTSSLSSGICSWTDDGHRWDRDRDGAAGHDPGDVAVALHPDDARDRDAIGRAACPRTSSSLSPLIVDPWSTWPSASGPSRSCRGTIDGPSRSAGTTAAGADGDLA